jgi:hypothetical protein
LVDLLPPCTVVRFPFDFKDGRGLELKMFLVVGHRNGCAILIKTTSRTEHYKSRPELLAGVVVCTANQYAAFKYETVIDPENDFAVPHSQLQRFYNAYTINILGSIPELRDLLIAAITNNRQIEPARKNGLLGCLD